MCWLCVLAMFSWCFCCVFLVLVVYPLCCGNGSLTFPVSRLCCGCVSVSIWCVYELCACVSIHLVHIARWRLSVRLCMNVQTRRPRAKTSASLERTSLVGLYKNNSWLVVACVRPPIYVPLALVIIGSCHMYELIYIYILYPCHSLSE